jgi:hypothetical protein
VVVLMPLRAEVLVAVLLVVLQELEQLEQMD